jgi:TM2 domain-containing membrane protein YozV
MKKRNPFLAAFLSLVVPGLGQFYCGQRIIGAGTLVAAIVIASLNILFIPLFFAASPDPDVAWAYWIPRIGHDVISFWSAAFWVWVVVDAYLTAKKG